jgi:putative transposase
VGEGGDEVSVARFIADQRTFYRVPHAFTCRVLAMSESWFYKWIKAPTTARGQRRAVLDEAVRRAFEASGRSYGSPRVYDDLIDPQLPHPELLAGPAADVPAGTAASPALEAIADLPATEAVRSAADRPVEAVPEHPAGVAAGSPATGAALVWRVSVNTVADSMRRQGLAGRTVKRNRGLTRQDRRAPKFPDLLKRDFTAPAPNLKWVGDITEIPTDEGKLYLASVLDLCARRLLAAPTSDHPDAELASDAIKMAVAVRGGAEMIRDVIFHTDRGSTYTANELTRLCANLDIRQSMGRVGSCFDNAAAESFFSTLEWEVLSRHHFRTKDEARQVISNWIEEFYNPVRRHSTAGRRSPIQHEDDLAAAATTAATHPSGVGQAA